MTIEKVKVVSCVMLHMCTFLTAGCVAPHYLQELLQAGIAATEGGAKRAVVQCPRTQAL